MGAVGQDLRTPPPPGHPGGVGRALALVTRLAVVVVLVGACATLGVGRLGRCLGLVGPAARLPALAVGAQPPSAPGQPTRHGNRRPVARRAARPGSGHLRHRRHHQSGLDGHRAACHGQARRLLHRGGRGRQLLLRAPRRHPHHLLRPAQVGRGVRQQGGRLSRVLPRHPVGRHRLDHRIDDRPTVRGQGIRRRRDRHRRGVQRQFAASLSPRRSRSST